MKFDKFKPNFKTINDFRCKSDEYKSCSTHQDLPLLFWSSCHLTKFEPFKFWNFKKWQVRTKIWDPKWFQHKKWWICKSDEYKSCSTHRDLQLLFWSSCHLTKFEPFKFEILKNDKFKPKFETQNYFNIKSDEYQSCSTH